MLHGTVANTKIEIIFEISHFEPNNNSNRRMNELKKMKEEEEAEKTCKREK